MGVLFFLLTLLSLIALITGLINPKAVLRWGLNRTRKRVFLYYGLAVIVFFILFMISAVTSNPSTPQQQQTKNTVQKAQNNTATTKKSVPKKASKPKKPLSLKDIANKAETQLKVSKVVNDKGKVTVTYTSNGDFWNENSMVEEFASDTTLIYEALFKDKSIKSVQAILPTKMTDQYGKNTIESGIKATWSRTTSNKVNYKNFENIVITNAPDFYNVSDSYYIHPGIWKNLKDEYKSKIGSFTSGD